MIIGKTIETLLGNLRDSFNRSVNGKQVVGPSEIIDLTQTLKSLTVPAGATEALMIIDQNPAGAAGTSTTPVARWSISTTDPQVSTYTGTQAGMPVAPMFYFTIKGAEALKAFRIIAINNVTGVYGLKVTYFK